jgi:hypothetical protein
VLEGAGVVACVVAECGGDVGLPVRRRMLMARLRRLAMMRGPLWVRIWEASSV